MATSQLALAPRRPKRFRLAGVPVFMYHGLTPGAESPAGIPRLERKYWVAESQFRDHLRQIAGERYRIRLLRDLWNGSPQEARQVAITFDDGRASDYRLAWPLVQDRRAQADFFVNTATIGAAGFLSWSEVREMHRSGMSFHSHGHQHLDLLRLSSAELGRQLSLSKQIIEDRLGCAVEFFSAPYGRLSAAVLAAAAQAGYRFVCGSRSWPAQPGARLIHRVAVYGHTSEDDFRALLTGEPIPYACRAARATLLYLPKQIWLPKEQQA